MEIFILANENTPVAKLLAKMATRKGMNPHHLILGSSKFPRDVKNMSGAIVFDDGSPQALESVARLRQMTRDNGAPVIVLASEFDRTLHSRFMAVGATIVCEPDETHERLLAEILSRHDLGVGEAQQIREQLLTPFIAATMEATEIMANVELHVEEIYRKKGHEMQGYVSGLIYLIGKIERILAVTLSYKTARELAKRMLQGAVKDPKPEIVSDTTAELVNIIAGQVKGRFVETPFEFDISTPTVITGRGHEIRHQPDLPCYVIVFKSELGPMALQLCIKPHSETMR